MEYEHIHLEFALNIPTRMLLMYTGSMKWLSKAPCRPTTSHLVSLSPADMLLTLTVLGGQQTAK